MSILFSGDFISNNNQELGRISKNSLIKKYGTDAYNALQYHIILGDANFMLPGHDTIDKSNYETLACRPFPILCVMGDSDPVSAIKNMPETDIGIGETVYQIQDNPFTAYLKQGKAYTIGGFKFLVLGGSQSMFNKNIRQYWSEEEKSDLFRLLETNNQFDCVISHVGPFQINYQAFPHKQPDYFKNEMALLNDAINEKIQFRTWLSAHWFLDGHYFDPEKRKTYEYLYEKTKILDRVGGRIKLYDEHKAAV